VNIKNVYPLPRIDDLFNQVMGLAMFSKIDLRSVYHQLKIKKDNGNKGVFQTQCGHYKFLVLPFGLSNAPAFFMHLMIRVLMPFLDKFIMVFINDIMIYTKTREEHAKHL